LLNDFNKYRHAARALYHYSFPRTVFRRYINNPFGEEIEMDFLNILVDPLRDAVDVGANFGRYSVRLAKLARQVLACEPHPRLAYVLSRCLPKNVTVRQVAISRARGKIDLKVPMQHSQQLESLATVESVDDLANYRQISVDSICLDELVDHDIGFIKIDVEGHEVDVIQGSLKLLAAQRPVVLIEADDNHRKNATSELFLLMTSVDYNGVFWYRDRFYDVADFDSSKMQDRSELKEHVPRKECAYVNNFVFAPKNNMPGFRRSLMKIGT